MLNEEERIYCERLQDLSASLIKMGAVEALPSSVDVDCLSSALTRRLGHSSI